MNPPISPLLRWARVAALLLALLTLAVYLAGIGWRVQQLRQVCTAPAEVCAQPGHVTPEAAAGLAAAGISLDAFAALQLAKWLFFSTVWVAVGALIFARRRDEWIALVTSYWLVTFPAQWDGLSLGLAEVNPALFVPINGLSTLTSIGLMLFLALFPNGRFEPPWTRWAALAGMVVPPLLGWVPASAQPINSDLLGLAAGMGGFAALVVAQWLRYRGYSNAVARSQTRWVIFGLSLATLLLIALVLLSVSRPGDLAGPGTLSATPLANFASEMVYQVAVALIPVSIGFAILRGRLFDIDVIIRRTLVYGVLSGLLALVYFGSVVVLEGALRGLTGGSQVAIVLSTLIIAALFGPLRGRVQRVIDSRFYRRKYDAARTLAAFGASARDEVDLDALGQRLTGVVDEAMQPATVGLWVRKDRAS